MAMLCIIKTTKGDKTMKNIYIIFDEDNNKVVLETVNRHLAFRFMIFSDSKRNFKMYIKKER